MATKAQLAEIENTKDELRQILKPGTKVYTQLKHVSSSGMSRAISVHVVDGGDIRDITHLVVKATHYNWHRNKHALNVGGAGMDMGFAVVYDLSKTLYPNGFKCTGHDGTKRAPRCPSNDHSNYSAELRNGEITGPNFRKGRKHADGGYALKQEWL